MNVPSYRVRVKLRRKEHLQLLMSVHQNPLFVYSSNNTIQCCHQEDAVGNPGMQAATQRLRVSNNILSTFVKIKTQNAQLCRHGKADKSWRLKKVVKEWR